eukprot:Nitzschia sp. Nitz4//scaffold40_size135432//115840//117748//NITZ4_003266-RA/size135432-snap-gene-0.133-mRNA-1//-1//CDS//3329551285//2979//frame0
MNRPILPAMPPRPVDSFPTFASTIDSTQTPPPVRTVEAALQQSDETQYTIGLLNKAITQEERLQTLKLALCAFGHKNVDLHDYEISMGADKALCLKLGYVVVTSSSSVWEETAYICQCLLHIYGCSSEQRKRSFRNIGATELVPLLLQVLTKAFTMEELDLEQSEVLSLVVRVLRVYAKIESAKVLLIRHAQGRWIGNMIQYCSDTYSPDDKSTFVSELLGLIKDLSFRSPETEKTLLMQMQNNSLVNFLAKFGNLELRTNLRLMEWSTAVVWNLVLDAPVCNSFMQLECANGFPIVRLLFKVLDSDTAGCSKTSTLYSKTQRNAVSALGNVLANVECRKLLMRGFGNSRNNTVIPVLMNLVENSVDSVVRRRAMRTLRCLACCQEPSTVEFFSNEGMPNFLAEIISRNISLDDENDRDMQIQACQTVHAMVDRLEHGDWPTIETALFQRVESTTDVKLIQAACSCFTECVKKSPWQRGPTCFSEMFWSRIESTVSLSSETHLAVATLILELANIEKSDKHKQADRPSALTSHSVVNTLTTIVSDHNPKNDKSRRMALDTVVLLLQEDANRRPLAENELLLSGLVNLCLLQPDAEEKVIAKQVIINLVPEM